MLLQLNVDQNSLNMPRVKGEGKMIFIVIGECCINVDKAKKNQAKAQRGHSRVIIQKVGIERLNRSKRMPKSFLH